MDKYVIDQNFEKFKSRKIHLDNYIIKKLGIVGNQTVLKINDFHLYCIPYDLGLRDCSVLMILDSKEIEFFKRSFAKIHSVHFVFNNPIYKKPISLFNRCKITNLNVMNPETRHCLVTLEYTVIPNDYKEILINFYKRNEALEYLFKNEQFRGKSIKRQLLKLGRVDDSIHLRTEKGTEPLKMLIINSSMSVMKIIGDDPDETYMPNTRVQIELFSKDNSFFVAGIVVTRKDSDEIPGYSILDIKLDFSGFLTDIIYTVLKKASSQEAQQEVKSETVVE
ncbi:MAG: hypothetical protein JXR86_04170 [Spirochaetales bacterium]|nr:hypothetical protein [Spirochaetales bacterium]